MPEVTEAEWEKMVEEARLAYAREMARRASASRA
jgi:hypothetical protein